MRSLICLVIGAALVACSQNSSTPPTPDSGQGVQSSCVTCVSTTDCRNHELCVQLSPSSVCTAECSTDADCAATDKCVPLVTSDGMHVSTCIARDNSCGQVQQGTGGTDGGMQVTDGGSGGTDGGSNTMNCADYKAPQTQASCMCKAGHTCTPNGCFGGYYCFTGGSTPYCTSLPASCGGLPPVSDALGAGGPVTATIDPKAGGTMDRLHFAIVGDTRPATVDDSAHYPTDVINGIYTKIAAANPGPAFVIATGDYAFATPGNGEAANQMDIYLTARNLFKGAFWPVMGNHECDGGTASNCTTVQGNVPVFMTKMLTPIGEKNPWYVRHISATDGSWTAKFIFLAPNSWGTAQSTFLKAQLAKTTTYTFVIRHEPSQADSAAGSTQAPGTAEIDSICKGQPITLMIEGHSHTWFFYDYTDSTRMTEASPKEVIVGNGGAPMTTPHPMGYTIISQRKVDGTLYGTNYDYTTGMKQYTFSLKPDGSLF